MDRLSEWYASVRRPLPWRSSRPDPYRVWISEIMSQQSTMATVIPYFERWMKSFPDLETLASAPEPSVLAAWAGLGYYSRARNVLRAAQALLARRVRTGQEWPQKASEWLELPGVGPYTAAAVGAIAFGDPVLPLDGNVLRVLARVYGVRDPLNRPGDRRAIEERLASLARDLPAGRHGTVAQALMELGSLVCRPGALAQCELCPLAAACVARRQKLVAKIPAAKTRAKPHKIISLALIYTDSRGRILVRQIPPGRRLGGQWELPQWEMPEVEGGAFVKILATRFELHPKPVRHAITKHQYLVYRVEAGRWTEPLPSGHAWTNGMSDVPGTLTTLTRKILLI